jgi:hypothetical protein
MPSKGFLHDVDSLLHVIYALFPDDPAHVWVMSGRLIVDGRTCEAVTVSGVVDRFSELFRESSCCADVVTVSSSKLESPSIDPSDWYRVHLTNANRDSFKSL